MDLTEEKNNYYPNKNNKIEASLKTETVRLKLLW